MDHDVKVVKPANLEELAAEVGDIPANLSRGEDINMHHIGIILREVSRLESGIIDLTRTDDYASEVILGKFYGLLCNTMSVYSNKIAVNMILSSLRKRNGNLKQLWIAIVYAVTGVIKPFNEIKTIKGFDAISRKRKVPAVIREEDVEIMELPNAIGECEMIYTAIMTPILEDFEGKTRIAEGYSFNMPYREIWFTVLNEFVRIARSDTIAYRNAGAVSIHNALVHMAIGDKPMVKKPKFKSGYSTLLSYLNPSVDQISKDEKNLVSLMAYYLKRKNFAIGESSMVDAPYMIDRVLPVVAIKGKKDNEDYTQFRKYSPFGWHKVASEIKRDRMTVVLRSHSLITSKAKEAAIAWSKNIKDLSQLVINDENYGPFDTVLRLFVSVTQDIKKAWVKSELSPEDIVDRITIYHRVIPLIKDHIIPLSELLSQADKGDITPLKRWVDSLQQGE